MSRRTPAARRLMAGVLVAIGLTGCGINGDAAPRDIVAPVRPANSSNGQTAITATSTSVIYLIGHDDRGRFVLRPTARDVTETIDNALQALFSGPTQRELNGDLRSAIPARTRLLAATPNNDIVTVDVTQPLLELSGSALVDAVGQIVLTATDVTGVRGVVITVDGIGHPWPTASGRLVTDPLTRADYVALLPGGGVAATDPTLTPTSGPAPTAASATAAPTAPPTAPPSLTGG